MQQKNTKKYTDKSHYQEKSLKLVKSIPVDILFDRSKTSFYDQLSPKTF